MRSSKKYRAHTLFEVLVREHHRMLLAYGRSLVHSHQIAEDLVQQSFIVAWDKFDDYDTQRDFGTWLRGIVRFEYLHWVRRKKEIPLEDEMLTAIDSKFAHWHSDELRRDLISEVRTCVEALPEPFHRIVQLTYSMGLSSPEAATAEKVSEGALRKRLQRARERVAECLQETLVLFQRQ